MAMGLLQQCTDCCRLQPTRTVGGDLFPIPFHGGTLLLGAGPFGIGSVGIDAPRPDGLPDGGQSP
jgi:hypothetical protein